MIHSELFAASRRNQFKQGEKSTRIEQEPQQEHSIQEVSITGKWNVFAGYIFSIQFWRGRLIDMDGVVVDGIP